MSAEFLQDVLTGLERSPKAIPGKYLWDEAGLLQFDRICGSADYYPTSRESVLLRSRGGEIAEAVGECSTIVEFGSGSIHKVRILLDALRHVRRYVAIDICGDYLAAAVARLSADVPELEISQVEADFTKPLTLPPDPGGGRVAFFPGTTIGTFNRHEAVACLANMRAAVAPGWLLLGADPNEDPASLARAYSDGAGLMAGFHLNLLVRMRRELGSTIDPAMFHHEARLFGDPPRVEAHLVADRAAEEQVGGHAVSFRAGESIRTDFSYKYAPEMLRGLAREAGWEPVRCWLDEDGLFSLHLLRSI